MTLVIKLMYSPIQGYKIKFSFIITNITIMFNWLKKMYNDYRDYIRIDLIMYGVWILLIVLFLLYTVLAD